MEQYKTDDEIKWSLYFGRNLQRMLRIKNVTQQQLARKLGTTDAMISRYVYGAAIPSVYKVCQIANIIGCRVDDLVKTVYEE